MRNKGTVAALMLSAVLILGGCSADKAEEPPKQTPKAGAEQAHEHGAQSQLPNGDLREVTASKDKLPEFLNSQSKEIQMVYALAAQVSDELEYVPCYCGCGESAGHKSNLNCFINEIRDDGSVEWDDHGTRCGVCLDIAVETAKLKSEGTSLTDIRSTIDEKYKTGYAKPTPTPMPKESN